MIKHFGHSHGIKWVCNKNLKVFYFFLKGSSDIPAMVKYILAKTNHTKLAYVGHSQGCTQALACFTSGCDTDIQSKISIFIALAPVATLANVTSPFIKTLATLRVDKFIQFLGVKEFLPSSNLIHFLVPGICDHSVLQKSICENLYCLLAGCDTLMDNVNTTRIPVYLSHLPGGTSVMDAAHWIQLIRSKQFQKYDYGKDGNIQHYHQPSPPLYDFRKMNVKIMVYHGGKDTLSTPGDVFEWLKIISKLQGSKYLDNYGHGDFVWGIKARQDIYEDLIARIKASFD
jgi:pimeloyl-ACP methyl ester carboxylesterase